MNAQEQQLIDGLVDRVKNVPVADKDDEADKYLHQQLDNAPDALYVLAQTVLVQQYGLTNAQQQLQDAQAQIEDLQQQLAQAQAQKKPGSFLGHLLGTDQPSAPPPGAVPYQPVNTGYPPPPPYAYGQPPMYGQPMGYAQPPVFGGGGGFLQGALQTAAGVAAGEMVFRGMEDLFSGFGSHEHLSGGGPTEVINNNYYDEPRSGEHHGVESAGDDSGFYDRSHDASREDDSSQNDFADTRDDGSMDDGGYDDGGGDDGGGFDDGN